MKNQLSIGFQFTKEQILNPTKEQFELADKEMKGIEHIESKFGLSKKGEERAQILRALIFNYIGNNRGI